MLTTAESTVRVNQWRQELSVVLSSDQSNRVCTCESCPDNDKCEWSWDFYNTDGDCLAIK